LNATSTQRSSHAQRDEHERRREATMSAASFARSTRFSAVLSLLGITSSASAEAWSAPSREFARYGVRTIVCERSGHTSVCLGLACRHDAFELVSAAGGGGPMEGATTVANGRSRFTVNFVFDPKALDLLGLAASRAVLNGNQFSALAHASKIRLTAGDDRSIQHSFSSEGHRREWQRVRSMCSTAPSR
jgi:hypothetical protein